MHTEVAAALKGRHSGRSAERISSFVQLGYVGTERKPRSWEFIVDSAGKRLFWVPLETFIKHLKKYQPSIFNAVVKAHGPFEVERMREIWAAAVARATAPPSIRLR